MGAGGTLCEVGGYDSPSPLSRWHHLSKVLFFYIFAVLPDAIPPINKDGLIISFECRPVFSNVMEIKISALNANPVPLREVVMELEVPHVSCPFHLLPLNCF